jgi:sulfur-oxidizing protein SoxY
MDEQRRKVIYGIGGGSLLFAGGLLETASAAEPAGDGAAFETHSLADAVRALGGSMPVESSDVVLSGPDLAENGALVPFTIESRIAGTSRMAILVEKNPWIVAITFGIPAGTDPWVTTRLKMNETSKVIGLAGTADGRWYSTARPVKVTAGGCS